MYKNYDHNLIDCAVIKVDSVRKSATYEQDGSALTFGYNYTVRKEDIEPTMKFIKDLFTELNIPCSRVYISGFACLTEDYIWTKQRITNHALMEARNMEEYSKLSTRK